MRLKIEWSQREQKVLKAIGKIGQRVMETGTIAILAGGAILALKGVGIAALGSATGVAAGTIASYTVGATMAGMAVYNAKNYIQQHINRKDQK